MPSERILLVEDDLALADSIQFALESEGFEVVLEADGESGLEQAIGHTFDLLILDLSLPRLPGMEVCRRVRSSSALPILILSARDSEADRVLGLEAGADDYVTKPVSLTELISHIRAILRRRQLDRPDGEQAVRRLGGLEIDLIAHRTFVDGEEVELTPSEFAILSLLSERPGRAFKREEIMAQLWRSGHVGDARACDTHVVNIRRKIESEPQRPRRLQTVRGVGYRLTAG